MTLSRSHLRLPMCVRLIPCAFLMTSVLSSEHPKPGGSIWGFEAELTAKLVATIWNSTQRSTPLPNTLIHSMSIFSPSLTQCLVSRWFWSPLGSMSGQFYSLFQVARNFSELASDLELLNRGSPREQQDPLKWVFGGLLSYFSVKRQSLWRISWPKFLFVVLR